MKRLLSILAIVALIISSCVPAEQGLVPDSVLLEGKELTVKAIMGDVAATKTAIQSDGTSIYWTKSDDINLFYGSSLSGRFTTGINSPSATADFSGTLASTGASNSGTPAFWAVYPYNAANTCDGASVTLTIPDEQAGVAGSFADKLNPSVAKASDTDLSFYNVGSWFIFSVAEEGIVSATLKGNGNEIIAGKVRVSMDDNSRPVAEVIEGEGKQSIMMTPAEGGSFAVGSYYYFVLLPQSLANGYSVIFSKSDGTFAECIIDKEAKFERAHFRKKSNADEGLTYYQTGNISFADATVKSISISNWDTNGDGELSYKEAAVVEDISTVFRGQSIKTFDEFQLFTGVTSIADNAFNGCSKLTSINIPSGVTSIGRSAFSNCAFLSSIVLPDEVISISEYAFIQCTRLSSINIPSGVTSIERGTFSNCYVLSNVVIPDGVTTIGDYSFWACESLSAIDIPRGVTSIGVQAFSGCCDLSVIYSRNTTPPSLGSGAFDGSTCKIRVPDDSLNDYLFAWPSYSNRIVAMSSVSVTGVSLDRNSMMLDKGSFQTLTASVTPNNATNKNVTWTSSDSSVASVDANGKVTGVETGIATITVTTQDGGFTDICDVTVNTVPVTGLSLNKAMLTLAVNESSSLVPTVTPDNATDKTVTWSSSDASIATVSSTGVVTGINEGQAIISAQCGDFTATCFVDVFEAVREDFNPSSYLIYRANESSYGSVGDYRRRVSYMPGISGAKVEMKFQLTGPGPIYTSNMSRDSYDYLIITSNSLAWNEAYKEDGDWWDDCESFPIPSATSLLLIQFNGVSKKMTINGNVLSTDRSSMGFGRLFASYDHESDEGIYEVYEGVPDGSKLYYVKVWDADGTLNQLGYATTSVNPTTNLTEYCWCSYYPKTGEVTYTFANDAANQGGFEGYTYSE